MAEIRTFIAIAVDQAIIARMTALQQQLRHYGADIAWTRPEGMHLTIKFLGNVDAGRLPLVEEALTRIAESSPPLTLTVAGTGGFPTLHRPRVLWAGITGRVEQLTSLAQAVDDALTPLGFPREDRPFNPHLTLGRVKSPVHLEPLLTEMQAHGAEIFGTMTAQALLIYRSDLSPQGATYTALYRAPFTGAEP